MGWVISVGTKGGECVVVRSTPGPGNSRWRFACVANISAGQRAAVDPAWQSRHVVRSVLCALVGSE